MYVYVYVCKCMSVYVGAGERERNRERERKKERDVCVCARTQVKVYVCVCVCHMSLHECKRMLPVYSSLFLVRMLHDPRPNGFHSSLYSTRNPLHIDSGFALKVDRSQAETSPELFRARITDLLENPSFLQVGVCVCFTRATEFVRV
jgi:hypothetical protein